MSADAPGRRWGSSAAFMVPLHRALLQLIHADISGVTPVSAAHSQRLEVNFLVEFAHQILSLISQTFSGAC